MKYIFPISLILIASSCGRTSGKLSGEKKENSEISLESQELKKKLMSVQSLSQKDLLTLVLKSSLSEGNIRSIDASLTIICSKSQESCTVIKKDKE